jgi:hypothetical protein
MKEQMQELCVEGLASHNGPLHAAIIAWIFPKRCSWVRTGELLLHGNAYQVPWRHQAALSGSFSRMVSYVAVHRLSGVT